MFESKTVRKRFHQMYTVTEDGCWIWKRVNRHHHYYGHLYTATIYKRNKDNTISKHSKMEPAHRVSYKLHRGEIPDDLCVCHRCDIPSCVNPDHLFLGTIQDNMDDKVAKGRQQRYLGEENPNAILTEMQVREIYSSKASNETLARKYGCSTRTIYDVKKGITWSHITAEIVRTGDS